MISRQGIILFVEGIIYVVALRCRHSRRSSEYTTQVMTNVMTHTHIIAIIPLRNLGASVAG
jgi:heme/copper-type cytochrome/quinol oxidase subunit 2